ALQTEVENNCLNEKQFNQLEREYSRYEQEIQDLNKDIERLENASEEEIA
ncbi:4804_t:CDS:1, partial [Funneliformis geosporum]